MNQELPQLEAELGPLYEKARAQRKHVASHTALDAAALINPWQGQLCAFGCYVYGLVLTGRERKAEARAVLVRSANEYPLHWGTWLALQALCTDEKVAATLDLRQVSLRQRARLRMHALTLATSPLSPRAALDARLFRGVPCA